jgi:hypothetical protein
VVQDRCRFVFGHEKLEVSIAHYPNVQTPFYGVFVPPTKEQDFQYKRILGTAKALGPSLVFSSHTNPH